MFESIELPPTPTSVAAARRWSEHVLDRLGSPQLADTMALLVSELVSNVVLHAGTPCWLRIGRDGGTIRVEVEDGSERFPDQIQPPDLLSSSGRGLVLVDSLSEQHGMELLETGGKRVWFELVAASSDPLRGPRSSINGASA